jgi:hypothetical protein
MNRRDVLDRLWRTGDLDQAAAAVPPRSRPPVVAAAEDQPPQIIFAAVPGGTRLPAPGVLWAVNTPNPRLSLRIVSGGKAGIRDRRITFDERPMARPPIAGPVAEFAEDVQVELVPDRRVRLVVTASNGNGGERSETMDLIYLPAQPVAPEVDRILASLTLGNIVYNTPSSMRCDEKTKIQLLLSPRKAIEELKQKISGLGEKAGEQIRVADVMEAHLYGKAFETHALRPERQAVGGADDAEWQWEIVAKEPGNQELHLVISAVLNVNGREGSKVLMVYDRTIVTRSKAANPRP